MQVTEGNSLHYSELATKNEVMSCCSSPDKVWQMQITSLNPFGYVWCCMADLLSGSFTTQWKNIRYSPEIWIIYPPGCDVLDKLSIVLRYISFFFLLAPKSTEKWLRQCNNVIQSIQISFFQFKYQSVLNYQNTMVVCITDSSLSIRIPTSGTTQLKHWIQQEPSRLHYSVSPSIILHSQ